jgi:hypothetical protein
MNARQHKLPVAVSNRFPLEAMENLLELRLPQTNISRCNWQRYHFFTKGLIISITAIGEADEMKLFTETVLNKPICS